ncbi:MAG: hypothetical protein IKS49_03930 [Actinomycetaceae bacterium]|nr:hypothetical protein [Actinomycetaceae bacterium]
MNDYVAIAEDGTLITEEMAAQWGEEVERGNYTIEPLSEEDRAKRKRMLSMSTHSIRVADSVWELATEQARLKGITMSAFMREALIEKVARAQSDNLLATV